jgi:hypothetical protein
VVNNVVAFPQTRTLAQVLAELMLAEGELRLLDRIVGSDDPSPVEDARWTQLEDTIWLRRDEAKAMIEAATGVSWSSIEGANL